MTSPKSRPRADSLSPWGEGSVRGSENPVMHHSFTARRLAPPLFLFAILTAGWFVTSQAVEAIPLCVIRYFSGIECPGCGLTRSFLSMARLDIGDAFRFNAAGPLIYVVFVGALIESSISLFRGSFRFKWPTWLVGGWGSAVVVVLFVHWIYRIREHLDPFVRGLRELIV